MMMALYKAQRVVEGLPGRPPQLEERRTLTRTVLDEGESFNGWPVWAVPASFGEQAYLEQRREESGGGQGIERPTWRKYYGSTESLLPRWN
jgi:hypothetical protein